MKKFVLFFILLMPTALFCEISTATFYEPQSFDVLSYDAEIDLTQWQTKAISGKCDITYKIVLKAEPCYLYFHLKLNVDSLKYGTAHVKFTAIDDYFRVSVQDIEYQTMPDTLTLSVYYHGQLTNAPNNNGWGGVSMKNGILYAMGVGFTNSDVSATKYWLPCYDHPSDKAKFHAKFLVPRGIDIASIGKKSISDISNYLTQYEYTHDFPVATYLMTFAMGDYSLITYDYVSPLPPNKTIPLEIFSKSQDQHASALYYNKLPEILATYEKYFGPYPFEKIGYVNTPTGSMEHQTMISLDELIVRNSIVKKDSMAMTAAHELAHQWFGNMVTPLDFRDAWLNEGFASYAEAIWTESVFGKAAYINYLQSQITEYFQFTGYEGDLSLYDFSRAGNSSNYPATIYKKGSAVVGLLRYELGDSLFFQFLKSYLDEYKYSNVTTENLQNKLEAVSGRSFKTFFDQWVYAKGYPTINVDFDRQLSSGADSSVMTINQVQPDDFPIYEHLPIEITFMQADGETSSTIVDLTQKTQSFTLRNIPPTSLVSINRGANVRVPMKVRNIIYASISEKPEIKIAIFPNPAENFINVNYPATSPEIYLTVYSILGEKIVERRTFAAENGIRLNLPEMPQGVYFLKIDDAGKVKTQLFNVGK